MVPEPSLRCTTRIGVLGNLIVTPSCTFSVVSTPIVVLPALAVYTVSFAKLIERSNVDAGFADNTIFGEPPSAVRVITTFAFLYFVRAAGVIFTVKLTLVPTLATEAVTPSFVAVNFLATDVCLFAAAIAGSSHILI